MPPYVPHTITVYGDYTMLSCCIKISIVTDLPLRHFRKIIVSLLNEAPVRSEVNMKQLDMLIESLNSIKKFSKNLNGENSTLYLRKLVERLEQYPGKRICLDDMLKDAFFSKYHFIRKFKNAIGLTPHQFLMQNRVRKAQRLLNEYNIITLVQPHQTWGACAASEDLAISMK